MAACTQHRIQEHVCRPHCTIDMYPLVHSTGQELPSLLQNQQQETVKLEGATPRQQTWYSPLALRLPLLNTAHTVYYPLCGAAPVHIHPASPGACLLVPVYLRHSNGRARTVGARRERKKEGGRKGKREGGRRREGGDREKMGGKKRRKREERGRRGEVHVFG